MGYENTGQRRALLVISSHDKWGDSGKPTGHTVPEAVDAWKAFTDADRAVDFTAVAGGRRPQESFDRLPMPKALLNRDPPDIQAKLDSAPLDNVAPRASGCHRGGSLPRQVRQRAVRVRWHFPRRPLIGVDQAVLGIAQLRSTALAGQTQPRHTGQATAGT
jgi:hypothetical protein